MEQAGGNRPGDGGCQRRRDPCAGIAQDVGHLQHAGAKPLTDQPADAVLPVAHNGKADHLGAAARHGGTAGQPGQPQRCADGCARDGQRQCHADEDRNENAHQQGLQLGSPHDQAAHGGRRCADGRGAQRAEPYANQDRDRRGDQNIDLGLLAYQLADLGRHNGNQVDGQRAACTAQLIGGTAHGNQAEQHQLRCMERIADGGSHGRACHGSRIAARRDKKSKSGLLAQGLDDRADEQAGKQALCHGAHRVNAVAMRRDDDILALEKRTKLFHLYSPLSDNNEILAFCVGEYNRFPPNVPNCTDLLKKQAECGTIK